MNPQKTFFTDCYGQPICLYKWLPENKPKAIVQLVHGMAEHAARYSPLAEYLVGCGIAVFANDHRGHGYTVLDEKSWGVLSDSDGFAKMVEDEKEVTAIIRVAFPKVPIILFGHSMGSFICRYYAAICGSQIQGLLLSGTGSPGYPELILGLLISNVRSRIFGRDTPDFFLDKQIFGRYNHFFSPCKTPFDWLSRDEKEVEKYLNDPMCGNVFPTGFYADFFKFLLFFKTKESVLAIPENLPVFLFSGEKDPVGNLGKGVQKVYTDYKKRGIRDLEIKLYPEGRHEMLNELNSLEVMADITNWVEKKIL